MKTNIEEIETLQGVYRHVPAVEAVAASKVAAPAEIPKVPDLAKQVAEMKKEGGGLYRSLHDELSRKVPEMKEAERGGKVRDGVTSPPNPRARGEREAVEFILTSLAPLVDDSASKGYTAGMEKEIERRRAEAKTKAAQGGPGSAHAMGAWAAYDVFLKRL